MIYYIWSLAVHSAVLSCVLISTVPCGPLCHALTCTCTYSPLQSTLPCSHMYSYLQSLAVHSAMLSHVLIRTVPCSPLCHALTCTRSYSPLRSTLPCSHMYSYVQFLAVHSAVLSCVLKLHKRQSTYITHRLRNLLGEIGCRIIWCTYIHVLLSLSLYYHIN